MAMYPIKINKKIVYIFNKLLIEKKS